MKFLLSLVLLTPMTAAAASSDTAAMLMFEVKRLPDGYYPQPGYCPEGTHRVFDEYTGRYICVPDFGGAQPQPWPRPGRCPEGMRWVHGVCEYIDIGPRGLEERMNGLKESLNGAAGSFFDGAFMKPAHTNPDVPVPSTGKPRPPRVVKVQQNDPTWGGATGRPPELPRLERPRQEQPRQEQPRQTPPPEIPRLPQSVIPGTVRGT